ncbi:hypothetical protein C9374_005318 [Naegleria lovaniensis]|uniref:Uncharacterized protein n=1 Tax=Naegleria lovaniensis TaxID=51637 RepID=A0AA88GRC0_NAELO|nr:uncharacterized protein C9374_005318 [Naegleria lovaniensis]KAG2382738.1 hypothetical protein C9374_005318 [Naegleria lovaniensis]
MSESGLDPTMESKYTIATTAIIDKTTTEGGGDFFQNSNPLSSERTTEQQGSSLFELKDQIPKNSNSSSTNLLVQSSSIGVENHDGSVVNLNSEFIDTTTNTLKKSETMEVVKALEEEEMTKYKMQQFLRKYCVSFPNPVVYVLVIVFGLSSWIAVNGIYSEIPILGMNLPEGYAIAVDMNLSLQLANIVPFLYFLLMVFRRAYKLIRMKKESSHSPQPQQQSTSTTSVHQQFEWIDTIFIISLLVIGIATLILMSFLWNVQVSGRSWPFLILMFFVGVCDCTSTLLYYPFVLHFTYAHSSALLIGESLTGLVASVISIIQTPSDKILLFPFWVFCIILAGITFLSFVAYCLLRFLPYCRRELRREFDTLTEEKKKKILMKKPILTWSAIRLLIFQTFLSFTENGLIVSILPYVFQNYRHHGTLLRYAITFGMIIAPIASGVAYLVPFYNFFVAMFSHLGWIIGACLLFFIALNNPNPPLKHSEGFGAFLVLVTLLTRALISFTKTKEFLTCHERIEKEDNEIFLKLTKAEKEKREQPETSQEGLDNGLTPLNGSSVTNENAGQNSLWLNMKQVLDLNPFRLAGFGIQLGALIATIIVKALQESKYFG